MTALEGIPAVLSLGPEGMRIEFGATLPPAPAPAPLRVSISRAKVLRQCPRRYEFEYVAGRRPARESHEQTWGAALHRGLESVYRDVQGAAEHRVALSWELTARDALSAALTPGLDSEGRPYTPPADPYARAALRAMLRAYAAVWGESDAARYEVVAVELPFDLPVLTAKGRESRTGGVPGARRVGRIDLVVRERGRRCPTGFLAPEGAAIGDRCSECGAAFLPGPVWAVEHKSTSMPPGEDVYYKGIEVDLQLATYFDALSILGYAPAGVLYDVVRRPDYHDPKPAPAPKKDGTARKQKAEVAYSNPRHGETASAYEERVYQLATSNPGDWFGRREFKAGEGPLTAPSIQDARADLHAAALEIRWRERTGLYPRPGDRYVCAPPGRRPPCAWLDVCAGRESATDDRLYPLKVKREGVE